MVRSLISHLAKDDPEQALKATEILERRLIPRNPDLVIVVMRPADPFEPSAISSTSERPSKLSPPALASPTAKSNRVSG
jgi:hypothetical protein